jgi:hypothetical protein
MSSHDRFQSYSFTADAIERQRSVDFLDGPDIVLHIKPVRRLGILVLGSRVGGQWQPETHLPLDAAAFHGILRCDLRVEDGRLQVAANGGAWIEHPVSPERLRRAHVPAVPGIRVIEPRDGSAGPSAPGEGTNAVSARILVADVMHVAAEVQLPAAYLAEPEDAELLVLIDGRVSARRRLDAVWREMAGAPIVFALGSSAFVADGMTAELVLEDGERRTPLACATVRSEFVGAVERCSERAVRGFLANPHQPGVRLAVDLFVNGRYEATVWADRPRPDLARFGDAYAQCGFEYNLPKPLYLPISTDASLSARVRDTDIELANSPWWICRAVTLDSVLPVEADERPANPGQAA